MGRLIRKYFITGILVLLPLAITIYFVWLGFALTDSLFSKIISLLFDRTIPGASTVLTLVLIFVVGIVTTNVIGRKLFAYFEKIFTKIPIVSSIYKLVKQIVDAFTLENKQRFEKMVMIEYPRPGVYAIGFLTNGNLKAFSQAMDQDMVAVFVPTTPNPTSGYLALISKEQVIPLDTSLEQGIKIIVSAGTVIPADDRMLPLTYNSDKGKKEK